MLGLSCAGVWLLLGMPWALIDVAVLLLLDLVADLLIERGGSGSTSGPPRA